MKKNIFALLALPWFATSLAAQPANSPRRDFWTADGPVFSVINTNGKIYLAGNFSVIGFGAAGGTTLDTATGAPDLEMPGVTGSINAVVSDGAGGWFIGGAFTAVGGSPRGNLAHIRSDRTVTTFNPNVSGPVQSLALAGNALYVGGTFTRLGVGSTAAVRTNFAAVNAANGAVLGLAPNPTGPVTAIAVFGSRLFIGGAFTQISGESRTNLAAIDAVSGAVTEWDPRPSGRVNSLQYAENELLVGGSFASISGVARQNLARVDPFTDTVSDWAPNPDGPVNAVLRAGTRIYVGGSFTNISGQPRRGFSSLDPVTAANGFDFGMDGDARTIVSNGSRVYIGGQFSQFGGNPRANAAAIELVNDNLSATWSSEIGGAINAMAATTNLVYVGGVFNSIGGERRSGLAALDEFTGQILPWNPNLRSEGTNESAGQVFSMIYSEQRIYAGGEFTKAGGVARTNLVAIDATTGEVLPWAPNPNGSVEVVQVAGTRLFLGGTFQNVGGLSRTNLAAVDLNSGAVSDWSPNPDGTVFALAPSEQVMYVGGRFSLLSGRRRSNVGAVNLGTGAATPWDPFSQGEVRALALDGGRLFVGGAFASIGAQFRTNLAALDTRTALATEWNTPVDRTVEMLRIMNGLLFVGGQFNSVNGLPRNRLAALNLTNAVDFGWTPSFNNQVFTVAAIEGGSFYVGGSFTTVSGFSQQGLAVFPPFGVHSLAVAPEGTNRVQLRIKGNAGERHILQGSTNMVDWTTLTTNTAGLPNFSFTLIMTNSPNGRFFRSFLPRQ